MCLFVSRHQNAGQNGNINAVNKLSENVTILREYLRSTLTNKNCARAEINLAGACKNSLRNLSFLFPLGKIFGAGSCRKWEELRRGELTGTHQILLGW